MVQNVDPIFLLVPKSVAVSVTAADTTDKVSAVSAGADGGAIVALNAASFDASDMIMVLSVNNGVSSFQIGEITVPAGAGTDGATPPVNLLDPTILSALNSDGALILGANVTFEIAAKATVGGDIDVTGIAGDY